MAGNNNTSGTSQPESQVCVVPQKITNKFKIMMSKACKAQKMVLLKRADDIMSWEGEQQRDFIKVFGLKGEDIIKIRKVGEDTGKRMQARLFIMDGIRRIMTIANGLTIESYKDYTNCNEFAAFISPHLDPPYIVNIGAHFEYRHGIKQSVTGRDSHVSTLCHEMSHIFWYWGDNQKGGMWTQDYTGINKFATSNKDEVSYEKHVSVANDLVTLRKDQLFENAYNVERYFYIKLNDEDIEAQEENMLAKKVEDKIKEIEKCFDELTGK
ncbi:peptidase M35 [Escherichia coli]|uniref:peptidase M35 n=1 Tax=Escherichia coli TaxID=562 RepID=UPI0006A5A01A|nr:peptidase M35 [Escherichia coli]EFD8824781.1 peptidase M35 [Escherichia coli]MDC9062443.1 peptidase M35 [Escherichia coli]QMN18829.1 peptidase M35 [Escherichia coli]HAX2053581.1 peptidase M35 [Escherichia coli]HBA3786207.1 peptidase M35 [Escherichia coli]